MWTPLYLVEVCISNTKKVLCFVNLFGSHKVCSELSLSSCNSLRHLVKTSQIHLYKQQGCALPTGKPLFLGVHFVQPILQCTYIVRQAAVAWRIVTRKCTARQSEGSSYFRSRQQNLPGPDHKPQAVFCEPGREPGLSVCKNWLNQLWN